jgi:aminopeptidase N
VWYKLLHDYYQRFKYQEIRTMNMVAFFNKETRLDLTAIFDEYLRHAAPPTLELKFDEAAGTVPYRWQAHEPGFAMPILVGEKDRWQKIEPITTEWKTLKTLEKKISTSPRICSMSGK